MIDRKHVDFLLCDAKTLQPIAGIELDDKSHQRADRQTRDEFVEQVFISAKLPLLRFPAKHGYTVSELTDVLKPYVGKLAPVVAPVPVPSPVQPAVRIAEPVAVYAAPLAAPAPAGNPGSAVPACPKCGNEMLLRTAKTGANVGEKFWGCPGYPKCRGIVKFIPA